AGDLHGGTRGQRRGLLVHRQQGLRPAALGVVTVVGVVVAAQDAAIVVAGVVAIGGDGEGVRADDLPDRPGNRDLLAGVGLGVVQDLAGGSATTAVIATAQDPAALIAVGQVRADRSSEDGLDVGLAVVGGECCLVEVAPGEGLRLVGVERGLQRAGDLHGGTRGQRRGLLVHRQQGLRPAALGVVTVVGVVVAAQDATIVVAGGGHSEGMWPDDLPDRPGERDLFAGVGLGVI